MGSISRKKKKRDNTPCAKCGETPAKPSIDHIHEQFDGGNGSPMNAQILCVVPCHFEKTKLFRMLRTGLKRPLTFGESNSFNEVYLTGRLDGLLRKNQTDAILSQVLGQQHSVELAMKVRLAK